MHHGFRESALGMLLTGSAGVETATAALGSVHPAGGTHQKSSMELPRGYRGLKD